MKATAKSRALLTPRQCAERLAVHPGTVTRWIRRGLIPAWRIGGVIRLRWEDVIAAMEGEEPVPTPPAATADPKSEKEAGDAP